MSSETIKKDPVGDKLTADHLRRLADRVEAGEMEWDISFGGNDYPMHTIKLIPRAFLISEQQSL